MNWAVIQAVLFFIFCFLLGGMGASELERRDVMAQTMGFVLGILASFSFFYILVPTMYLFITWESSMSPEYLVGGMKALFVYAVIGVIVILAGYLQYVRIMKREQQANAR